MFARLFLLWHLVTNILYIYLVVPNSLQLREVAAGLCDKSTSRQPDAPNIRNSYERHLTKLECDKK